MARSLFMLVDMKKLPPRVVADVLEQITERKFPYIPKEKKKRDWSAYNAARQSELPEMLIAIRRHVDDVTFLELRRGRGKPPKHSPQDNAKAVLLAELFQADERSASGLVSLFLEKLGIENEMSPRAIGRAYYNGDVHYILHKIIEKTNEPIQGLETSFSGDSTGISKSSKVNWARDKEDKETHRDFGMLSIMGSNQFHIISAYDIHEHGPINDAPTLPKLLDETKKLHPCMKKADFDAGFISRINVQYIANSGVEPYIFPKKNLTLKPKGFPAWRNMLYECITNSQEWLRSYHERSNIESINHCLDNRFTKPVRQKHFKGQCGKIQARISIHNLIQTHISHHEHKTSLFVTS